jgi:hypothetical protein
MHCYLIAAAVLLVAALPAPPAMAQTRVFVAAQGSDSNPCTFALPCRTFQHAHDVLASGGEINVLDPAGYGQLLINKSISIQGHGFSGMSVSGGGGIGIQVNSGASGHVSLHGLIIEGNGVGAQGIVLNTAASLVVDHCIIQNLTGAGILIVSTGTANVAVSDTIIDRVLNRGIHAIPSGIPTLKVAISRTGVHHSASGIYAQGTSTTGGTIDVAVSDSVVSGNANEGYFANANAGNATTTLSLIRSVAIGNGTGIGATNAATLRFAQSMISGNTVGFANTTTGSTMQSYLDNYVDGNGSNTGFINPASKQ